MIPSREAPKNLSKRDWRAMRAGASNRLPQRPADRYVERQGLNEIFGSSGLSKGDRHDRAQQFLPRRIQDASLQ